MEEKIIVMHGFTPEEARAVMAAVRTGAPASANAAFAMTTETNLEWKVGELMEHLAEEHRSFREAMAKRSQG